ncbi:tetratricopeptide repeat-containing serine protease family protein [Streptomyces sp. AC550_RSS872]|uniref:tetratricopeptide repeat-containing S1 family peptidase n=1 Tax=Streptomyces sp. AC550_RSS872 TaxID=2823689 RepID=UPI001C26851B|nr:tetratricopeptide repeat-containing serine protease family protein [Streptomyces sp. AC550_RSS872]
MAVSREQPPWLVSIRRESPDGPAHGVGVMCGPRHVLTCAHVIGRGAEAPVGPVYVRFQHVRQVEELRATVLPDGWHPVTEARTGDVAVLELAGDPPPGAEPAPLCTTEAGIWHHRFRAYGYPKKHARAGIGVRGEIVDHAGDEWLLLEPRAGWAPEPGFSGAPVWDEDGDAVIGILNARERGGDSGTSSTTYAIKTEALLRYWPPLAEQVREQAADKLRARIEARLALPLTASGELPRVGEVDPYHIGVTPSTYSGRRTEGDRTDTYVARRRPDALLEEALDSALSAEPDGTRLLLLVGPSKSGKSRTLFELLRRRIPRARLLVPAADRTAPEDLSRLRLPAGGDPVVLWLDELDHYLRPGGLNVQVLERFAQEEPPVVVVASMTSLQRQALFDRADDQGRLARSVLRRAREVELPQRLTDEELAEAALHYPDEDFAARGIGQILVAAPELERRLTHGFDSCPEGWAVTRAAADRWRMGLRGAVSEAALFRLFRGYMSDAHPARDADEGAFRAGLAWARETVAGQIALLHPARPATPAVTEDSTPGDGPAQRWYAIFPYVPDYLDTRTDDSGMTVPGFAWQLALNGGATVGTEGLGATAALSTDLLTVAVTAVVRDELDVAVAALRRVREVGADSDEAAWAAVMLGQLELARSEFERGRECLEAALESGVPDVVPLAQVELGGVLVASDRERAGELLQAAMGCRNRQLALLAQVYFSGLLILQGAHERALSLLDDVLAAGDDEVAGLAQTRLGGMLADEGAPAALGGTRKQDPAGSGTELLRPRAARTGEVPVPDNSSWTLSRTMNASVTAPITEFARTNMSWILANQGKLDKAEELLREVMAGGHPLAAPLACASLGDLLVECNRPSEAGPLLESVLDAPAPLAWPLAQVALGRLLVSGDEDQEQGAELLREVFRSGHPAHAPRAAHVLGCWHVAHGRAEHAEYRLGQAIASGHPDWAPLAELALASLAAGQGATDRAEQLLAAVAARPWTNAPYALDQLGDLLAEEERYEEAEAAYRQAIASGHEHWSQLARVDLALMLARTADPADPDDVAAFLELLAQAAASGHPAQGPRAAELRGELFALLDRYEEAEAAYRQAIDAHHDEWSHLARIHLALMLSDFVDPDQPHGYAPVAELLIEAMDGPRTALATWAQSLLGQVRIAEGDRPEGLRLLRSAVEADVPVSSDAARLFLAMDFLDDGQDRDDGGEAAEAQAAELLEQVLRGEPSEVTEVARTVLGTLRLRQGDHTAARQLLADGAGSGASEAAADSFLDRGEYLLEVGEIEMAAELLQAALDIGHPDSAPRVGLLLGVTYLAQRRLEAARDRLAEAVESGDPDVEPQARRYLGSTLAQLGRSQEAEEILLPLAAAEERPERPQALLLLAQLAVVSGRLAEAADRFEQVLAAADPEAAAEGRMAYAQLLRETGRWDRLAEILSVPADTRPAPETAPAPHPAEPVLTSLVLVLLGDVASAEQKWLEARHWYRRALAAPDSDQAQHRARAALGNLPD